MRYATHTPEAWEVGETYPVGNPLCEAVDAFFYRVLSLRDNFGRLTAEAAIQAETAEANWKNFLGGLKFEGEQEKPRTRGRFAFDAPPVKQPPYHGHFKRHQEASHLAGSIGEMMFLQLVATYDSFVGQVLRSIFTFKPEILRRSERSVSWEEISELSMEAARRLVIDKEVESLMRQSHLEQLTDLARRLDVSSLKEFDELGDFIEVFDRRNLIAHNDARSTIQYARTCERYGVSPGAPPGETLLIDDDYFVQSCNMIITVGVMLAQTLWRKIIGRERAGLADADAHLAYVTYRLLMDEDWVLAQRLLRYCTELKVYASDQRKYTFLINYAQTFKWLGDEAGCKRILVATEWDALDIAFQISAAVLREEWDAAADLMRQAALTRQVPRSSFDHWPIYRNFRQTPEFQDVYGEVFSRELDLTDRPSRPNQVSLDVRGGDSSRKR